MNIAFSSVVPVFLLAIFLWQGVLTAIFYKMFTHYKELSKGVERGNLISILSDIMKQMKSNEQKFTLIEENIDKLDRNAFLPLQKIGFVRFNPFFETGGDQSFVVSLLDREDNGFVLTCLHSRDRTRVYAKPIIKGKSEHELSDEEKKAIVLAQKRKLMKL